MDDREIVVRFLGGVRDFSLLSVHIDSEAYATDTAGSREYSGWVVKLAT